MSKKTLRMRDLGYQLLLGDCLDRLRELPDSSVDAIVTDPPYGLSKQPAMLEGFNFIGIEREPEYMQIAEARIEWAQKQKQEELPL